MVEVAEKKKVLSLEDIEVAPDREYMEIEAWGGILRVGSLNAGEMLEFIDANDERSKKTAGLRLIIKSIVDEDGNSIGDMKRLEMLKKKDAKTINRIVGEILTLNGLDEKKKAEIKNDSSAA